MKKLRLFILVLMGCSLLFFTSCNDDHSADNDDGITETDQIPHEGEAYDPGTADENQQQATTELNEAQEALRHSEGRTGDVKVIDYKELKKLLPEEVDGWQREDHSGERTKMMGMEVSHAEATYRKGDQAIDVDIHDVIGAGMVKQSMAMWAEMEIEQESDEEYKRTGTFEGAKSYEEYNKSRKRGSFQLLWDNRFIVQLAGTNIEMVTLKDFARDLPLENLE